MNETKKNNYIRLQPLIEEKKSLYSDSGDYNESFSKLNNVNII
jgi:hypothetical protein